MTPELTLHHILSMSSASANYIDEDDETWTASEGVIVSLPGRGRRPADIVPRARPAREPATRRRVRDCDTDFVLVGLVLEAVTGREWSSVLADEVLRPVGMADTAVEEIDRDPIRIATGYIVEDGPSRSAGRTCSA